MAQAPAVGVLDDIDSRSTVVARAWSLPTLLGLPYLPRVEQAGFGAVSGVSKDNPERPIGLAVLGLVHRFGMGPQIGIATPADIVAKLDDAAAVSLAYLYLPTSAPNPAGGPSCHDLIFARSGGGGRGVFALRDLATRAQSVVFPAQAAAAPFYLPPDAKRQLDVWAAMNGRTMQSRLKKWLMISVLSMACIA